MSGAYYNEHDPKAAAWLRELIKAGLIADGEVDERSIEDVLPNELAGFTQCHFFAGIGVWSYALRQAGWPDDRSVWTGSCPCQPFSAAGKGDGFADERHLWPAFHYLISQRRPPVVLGEQVASKDADAWIDLVHTDMEALGYAFGSVPFPAAGVGAPNIRDRLYWVADATSDGRERRRSGEKSDGRYTAWRESERLCDAGWLANTSCERRHARGDGDHGGDDRTISHATRSDGRLVHPLIEGLEGQPRNGNHRDEPGRIGAEPSGSTAEDGGACGMADSDGGESREERRIQSERNNGQQPSDNMVSPRIHISRASGQRNSERHPSPTNGFWRDADWLFCRDGKFRPVEPGTFPLVNGAPARVGRLRGYGNAINAAAAQAFIESYLGI